MSLAILSQNFILLLQRNLSKMIMLLLIKYILGLMIFAQSKLRLLSILLALFEFASLSERTIWRTVTFSVYITLINVYERMQAMRHIRYKFYIIRKLITNSEAFLISYIEMKI